MSDDVKPLIIKAEIMYPYFAKKNDMSGKYQVDLCNLSEAACEALDGMGISTNYNEERPEKGMFITCKSSYAIRPLDTDKKEIDLDVISIGNGSMCKAAISPYQWTFKKKKGISPNLRKLVVTELVEYEGGEDSFDMDEEEAL